MSKTLCSVSQAQVLVTCGSVEEAQKLANSLSKFEVDTIDDALERLPGIELELKALQADRLTLLDKINKLTILEKEGTPKKEKEILTEKPLGKNKRK